MNKQETERIITKVCEIKGIVDNKKVIEAIIQFLGKEIDYKEFDQTLNNEVSQWTLLKNNNYKLQLNTKDIDNGTFPPCPYNCTGKGIFVEVIKTN